MAVKKWIIGVDEVGRGPLAGPVYIGVFAYQKGSRVSFLKGIKDSKLLRESKRDAWHKDFTIKENVRFATASTSAKKIDEKGIVWAIQSAIQKALKKLNIEPQNADVFLDGGLKAPEIYTKQKTVIKGDQIIPAISAASIIAKVTRDKRMKILSKKYPEYDFAKHKGYGTKFHREMIVSIGLSPEHRKTYCKNLISKKV